MSAFVTLNSNNATAFWITATMQSEIRPVVLPPCTEDQVRIRTLFTAISRGTESLVYKGKVPPTEYERMRAPFQEGNFPYPLKYGYINVGRVEQGPDNFLGKNIFCLFPHQTQYVVPVSAITVLPDGVPPERAVLCANMETAVNALWDAAPAIGDKITIVGGGVVGCLVAWLAARIPGCDVELVDIKTECADVATALGARFCTPNEASDERDLIIHASASEQGLHTALDLAAFEATVLELSWYGDTEIRVPLGGAFHSKRLQLRSSQVGHIALSQRARWSYSRRLNLAMSFLHEPVLDQLISGESTFKELPETLKQLATEGRYTLCHRIRYDQ